MSKKLIDLTDRYITDDGKVIFTYESLLKLARDGQPFHDQLVEPNDLIELYNRFSNNKLQKFEEGNFGELSDDLFIWNTPSDYSEIDIELFCVERMEYTSDVYLSRLSDELAEIEKRKMEPLVRHLIYMVDHFRKNDIVWGVGRGSSCASLVMYLIGINKIDPVLYEIPMDEFFR